jgi:hypothetical protein
LPCPDVHPRPGSRQDGREWKELPLNASKPERTKVTVIVNDKATDSGTVPRRGKDPRIMVDITKPEQQRMLVDQGSASFFPKLKQVQEYFLGQNQDKAEFLLMVSGNPTRISARCMTPRWSGKRPSMA